VNEPGAGHRLDAGADRLSVHLIDPPRQPAQRVDVGRNREPVETLSPPPQQADIKPLPTEVAPSTQHVKRGLLGTRLADTAERLTNRGPFFVAVQRRRATGGEPGARIVNLSGSGDRCLSGSVRIPPRYYRSPRSAGGFVLWG
jgi:hypothetical protein